MLSLTAAPFMAQSRHCSGCQHCCVTHSALVRPLYTNCYCCHIYHLVKPARLHAADMMQLVKPAKLCHTLGVLACCAVSLFGLVMRRVAGQVCAMLSAPVAMVEHGMPSAQLHHACWPNLMLGAGNAASLAAGQQTITCLGHMRSLPVPMPNWPCYKHRLRGIVLQHSTPLSQSHTGFPPSLNTRHTHSTQHATSTLQAFGHNVPSWQHLSCL